MKPLKALNGTTIGDDKNEDIFTSNGTDIVPSSTYTGDTTYSASDVRVVQNFRLIWLDNSIDDRNDDDCINTITNLRQIVNTVQTFINVDECLQFINNVKDEKIFLIVSGAVGETTVPLIHHMEQINSIYIFCKHKEQHEQWAKEWSKVKGVYTDIIPICQALRKNAQDCDHNSISISFVQTSEGASSQDLDTLDKSFMYTQLLKEILLTINFESVHFEEFLSSSRGQFIGNNVELKNIDKLRKEYRDHQPIWWYTYQCFLYSMLNRALRLMEVDLIIKMGFFVRDLHNHIVELHSKQYGEHHHSDSFTVYRGQGLSQADFDQLNQTQGGLLSFNNFLSTSTNSDVSLDFARRTMATSDLFGVLFIMTIDPSLSTTPFANVKDVGYYAGEEEILFSMHSVFRIGEVKQIDGNIRLWQVDLILTSDNDPQLYALTERMREETFPHLKGWYRLGNLLVTLGEFAKAQQVFETMLDQITDEREKASIYHMLGIVKDNQGEYAEAVGFYETSIKINQKILPPTHSDFASSYGGLGLVYNNMGEYSKALSYYERDLEICQKTLPANHPNLATTYNNIGLVYNNMGEYSKALSSHEKAFEIYQKTLPANHPGLASSYGHIGMVSSEMGEHSKAVLYCERALKILEHSLPFNHPRIQLYKDNLDYVKRNCK